MADTSALQKLRHLQSRIDPARDGDFTTALTTESTRRAQLFITGVKAYRHHPYRRVVPDAPVIWQTGTTTLRDYNPGSHDRPIIFVIPSLINRLDVLDLALDHSFVRHLAAQGFRPIIMDWDSPGAEEKDFTISDYVTQRLVPALRSIAVSSPAPIHVAGYCMGGLLALALAQIAPTMVRSLTLIATPWDFHADPMAALYHKITPHLLHQLEASQEMSVDMIQGLFAAQQPFKVLNKFTAFAVMDTDSPTARHFVALEDWLNDGVPLTANVARECLVDWFTDNKTATGQWQVAGQKIAPQHIIQPSYILVPSHDRIVPPQSAMPLADQLPLATLHRPTMGHIGLMASRRAPQDVWAPFAAWLRQQSGQ